MIHLTLERLEAVNSLQVPHEILHDTDPSCRLFLADMGQRRHESNGYSVSAVGSSWVKPEGNRPDYENSEEWLSIRQSALERAGSLTR